jgi:hypothetical protein
MNHFEVAAPVLLPRGVALDSTVIEQYERELAQAVDVPLREDVDNIESVISGYDQKKKKR